MQYSFDKRFFERREKWIAPGPTIKTHEFGVELLLGARKRLADVFVVEHHYAGSMPVAKLCVGLFRKTGVAPAHLAGVAVFSIPPQQAMIPCYTGFSEKVGIDLGRFVLAPEVAYNGETWFLARAVQALRAELPMLRGFTSCADPLELRDANRVLTKGAHAGTIYQARRAIYCGRSRGGRRWLSHQGRILSDRSLSKIKNQERGHEGYAAQLLALGADRRRYLEPPGEWLRRVVPTIAIPVRHPGNHVYAFGLDKDAHAQIVVKCENKQKEQEEHHKSCNRDGKPDYEGPFVYPRVPKSSTNKWPAHQPPGTCGSAEPIHTDPTTIEMLYV